MKRLLLPLGLCAVVCLTATGCGPEEGKFVIEKPPDVTLAPGETVKMNVRVTRENLDHPVKLQLEELPPGVTVEEDTFHLGGSDLEATFTLRAAPDAEEVDGHRVMITGTTEDLPVVSQIVKVSVKKES